MKNDSTSFIPSAMKPSGYRRHRVQGVAPRRSTLAFLRQFARAYSCSPSLPASLGSIVAN